MEVAMYSKLLYRVNDLGPRPFVCIVEVSIKWGPYLEVPLYT